MATLTIELRKIVEGGRTDLGLSDYPIFDENYREHLNRKIIEHYWFHEIGFETVDMFIFQMRVKMNEIMPYFNKLYNSELIKIDPFKTHKNMHESETSAKGRQQSESRSENSDNVSAKTVTQNTQTSASKARAVAQDFPQTRLAGYEDYASQGSDTLSESGGESSGSAAETRTGLSTATGSGASDSSSEGRARSVSEGFSGSMSQLLTEYRSTFLNIDMMVIKELEPLFMSIYTTYDSMIERNWLNVYPY